jgi:light-regulated signal transduction histidine kinase (bacteriophytochrome)
MLEQIQERDAALVGANTELEARVEERTAALKSEIAVRRKAELDLADTVKKLKRSHRELREFTRISAHDLKTPLRAIGTLSDWIAEDYTRKFDEAGRQNAELLAGRARRMSNLLDAVMRYTDISIEDKAEEPVNVDEIVRDVIEELRAPRDIDITIETPLPNLTGDRKMLGEVFRNLIDNAVKNMDKPAKEIRIGCLERDDEWQFHVTDNGRGIDQKYHDKIFQIFQMLERRDETDGIGIGLSIVKKIVEIYDGHVWVVSEPGKGSTFLFALPKATTCSECLRPAQSANA